MHNHQNIQLGEKTEYPREYDPKLLFAIARKESRLKIGIHQELPFKGIDIWNAYELSWLNEKSLPQVAIGKIIIPCNSENIIESKSLKLYLNSINQTHFASQDIVQQQLTKDLCAVTNSEVTIKLWHPSELTNWGLNQYQGTCLDQLDVKINHFDVFEDSLFIEKSYVEETLYSHLLKSNCPVTNQPDWATIYIHYAGNQINHEGLLKYIVSFRDHNGFHENCVERIFTTLLTRCSPKQLSVYARYTRRGGLDINPYRSTEATIPDNLRDPRQ